MTEVMNAQKTKRAVRGAAAGSLSTYRHSLDREELVTVERMGIGVPVLLVVADLARMRCSFVCLNDYVDRILIPLHADYRSAATRRVHVPVHNDLSSPYGRTAVGWYGKRAKLMAGFQRFHYQLVELNYARGRDDFTELAQTFAAKVSAYDFWDDDHLPAPFADASERLQRFISAGNHLRPRAEAPVASPVGHERIIAEERVLDLWRQLDLLARTHEDVWQEFYLPTALGQMLSGPPTVAARSTP